MSPFDLVVLLIVMGVALYCAKKYIPMDESVKKIVTVVVVLIAAYLVLTFFGVIDYLRNIHIGKMR